MHRDGLCGAGAASAGGAASSVFPAGDDGSVTVPVLSVFVVELTVSSGGDDVCVLADPTGVRARRAGMSRSLRCLDDERNTCGHYPGVDVGEGIGRRTTITQRYVPVCSLGRAPSARYVGG